jgi:hypothetical protein
MEWPVLRGREEVMERGEEDIFLRIGVDSLARWWRSIQVQGICR